MAANGTIELVWGDGEYRFCVSKVEQALELEEKCDAGVGEILCRLVSVRDRQTGEFNFENSRLKLNDVRETIRLGLIGGGMRPDKAILLVRRYVDGRPWLESAVPAYLILAAALIGVPGDDVGKNQAEGTATGAQPASSAPQSTEPAPPVDLVQDKLMA